jgi:hypothetical protein
MKTPADKFGIFVNVCVVIFIILLLMKLFISISWFIVFLPIIIPGILIMWEMGVFHGNN